MMRKLITLGLILLATGAHAAQPRAAESFTPPSGNYSIIVMRPDVAVSVLTTGGLTEPREDWTNTARENVMMALQRQKIARGGTTKIALTREEAGGTVEQVLELERLHEVVGRSVLIHQYLPGGRLPTKKKKLDWTLGELAVDYGKASGHDYAMFFFARDSFSSGGRQALNAIGVLGCIVGVCIIPGGGLQQAFVSLVDLKTGKVVWFNFLMEQDADIRTPEGANKLAMRLLSGMYPPEKGAKKKKA
jgi:hypothetical protein